MDDSQALKDKLYSWSNEVFSQPVFDPKTTNLMALVAALTQRSDGAVSYFYFSAKKAGATEAELADLSRRLEATLNDLTTQAELEAFAHARPAASRAADSGTALG